MLLWLIACGRVICPDLHSLILELLLSLGSQVVELSCLKWSEIRDLLVTMGHSESQVILEQF